MDMSDLSFMNYSLHSALVVYYSNMSPNTVALCILDLVHVSFLEYLLVLMMEATNRLCLVNKSGHYY